MQGIKTNTLQPPIKTRWALCPELMRRATHKITRHIPQQQHQVSETVAWERRDVCILSKDISIGICSAILKPPYSICTAFIWASAFRYILPQRMSECARLLMPNHATSPRTTHPHTQHKCATAVRPWARDTPCECTVNFHCQNRFT